MANKRRIARTATEGLKVLWEDNFFGTWRKKNAVVEELAKRENHFSEPELGMALVRAGHLTRRGRRGSYEYIQKYPYVPGDNQAPTSKKGGKS